MESNVTAPKLDGLNPTRPDWSRGHEDVYPDRNNVAPENINYHDGWLTGWAEQDADQE